jgi:hypothetical protein
MPVDEERVIVPQAIYANASPHEWPASNVAALHQQCKAIRLRLERSQAVIEQAWATLQAARRWRAGAAEETGE